MSGSAFDLFDALSLDSVGEGSADHCLWHRMDDETEVQFKYFCMYLGLGVNRKIVNMPKVYEGCVPSVTRLNKISSEHNWRIRAKAYDDHLIQERRRRYEEKLDRVLDEEFDHLSKAYETSHVLLERIENDTKSSTYSLLNAFRNWSEAHNKITDELYMISGKPKEAPRQSEIKALEATETRKVSDKEKIEEVTKALKMING